MIAQQVIQKESDIINDHIAFRTLGVPHLGIDCIGSIFETYGYQKRDYYEFKKKKLNAYWYAPPSNIPNLPRVFISELNVKELSQSTQRIIKKYSQEITSSPLKTLDLSDGDSVATFFHTPLWEAPTWEEYEHVLQETEYGAWVLYNRYYLNHFTITIKNLGNGCTNIYKFNDFLESFGVKLNDSGGKVKISLDGKLLQSSTVAEMINAPFAFQDGSRGLKEIAGSYVEFAERINGREGFEVGNADKIFESTFTSQLKPIN